MLLTLFFVGVSWLSLALLLVLAALSLFFRIKRRRGTVAFLHPSCEDMAGGERVLWAALLALEQQKQADKFQTAVYVARSAASSRPTAWADIIDKARNRFGLTLTKQPECVWLDTHRLSKPDLYRRFTMIGQAIGAIIMAVEALWRLTPDVLIDSTGYAFAYPIFRWLGGCTVVTYTHYPTVSTDMLQSVRDGTAAHNNDRNIAGNPLLTSMKLLYYRVFALIYGFVGRRAQRVMVNSSWTRAHIDTIWKIPARTTVVFPPVNTDAFNTIELQSPRRASGGATGPMLVVSISQFRPEKDQAKQIRAFAQLLQRRTEQQRRELQLVLIGSCRDDSDRQRVAELQRLAEQLNVSEYVRFELNAPFDVLLSYFARATVGLHTMWCEHFGIGIVELQAAGVVAIAHRSGGPLADIVQHGKTGFLAESVEEYADAMELVLFGLTPAQRLDIQERARVSSARFSDTIFVQSFGQCIQPYLPGN